MKEGDIMTEQEQKRACDLLDTQYSYIEEGGKQQYIYYDGMRVIIEDLLLGTDLCLVRDEKGKHSIESLELPF